MYSNIQRNLTAEAWLLTMYNTSYKNSLLDVKTICKDNPMYLSIFYKLIAETRDIHEGKGNREETYELIRQWIEIDEEQALNALEKVATQYGSWKDVKHLCLRLNQHPNCEQYQNFIWRTLQWMNNCLYHSSENEPIKKWIPRERSRFGIFYDFLATDYFQRIHGMDPKLPIDYYRKKYRQVLSKRDSSHSHKPYTRNTVENESVLIRQAFQYAITYFTEQEETYIENKWMECISKYPNIENGLPILDTLIYDEQQNRQPNMPVLLCLCRILYKTQTPTYKHVLITHTNKPVWIDLTDKSLVKCIQTILSIQTFHHRYVFEKNTPRENTLIKGVEWLVESIIETNTTVETVEKMVWLIISSFSDFSGSLQVFDKNTDVGSLVYPKTDYCPWHSKIQNCFVGSYVMPNIVYIQMINSSVVNQSPIVWTETPRAMWFTLNAEKGITSSQWRQITKISKDFMVRQFTCFQNCVDIINQDRYRDMELLVS